MDYIITRELLLPLRNMFQTRLSNKPKLTPLRDTFHKFGYAGNAREVYEPYQYIPKVFPGMFGSTSDGYPALCLSGVVWTTTTTRYDYGMIIYWSKGQKQLLLGSNWTTLHPSEGGHLLDVMLPQLGFKVSIPPRFDNYEHEADEFLKFVSWLNYEQKAATCS